MKAKYLITAAIFFLFLTNIQAQKQKNISVNPFNELEISGAYDVYLTQGNSYSIRIESDDEELSKIKFEQSGSKVKISFKENEDIDNDFKLWITIPEIKLLTVNGAVHLECENTWNLHQLDVLVNGASKMEWDINVQSLNIELNGASSVDMEGNAQNIELKISGAANFNAQELITQDFNIELAGAGNAKIYASRSLDANISGIGFIKYYGNPSSVHSDISLFGVLENADE